MMTSTRRVFRELALHARAYLQDKQAEDMAAGRYSDVVQSFSKLTDAEMWASLVVLLSEFEVRSPGADSE